MEIFAPLVGVSFRLAEAKEIVKHLTPDDGDKLFLQADPFNEYDNHAVKVMYRPTSTHLGFIAKENNFDIFEALESGETLKVEIVSFENTMKPILLVTKAEEENDQAEIASEYRGDPSL